MESFRANSPGISLEANRSAPLADVCGLLNRLLSLERFADLLWGLVFLDWSHRVMNHGSSDSILEHLIPREYALIKLLSPPTPLKASEVGDEPFWNVAQEDKTALTAKPDTTIFGLLASGQSGALNGACAKAEQRLLAAGLVPLGRGNRYRRQNKFHEFPEGGSQILLAALLFPISPLDTARLANLVLCPPVVSK